MRRPLLLLLLVLALAACSRAPVVEIDACAPLPAGADRLEVSFVAGDGATGIASYERQPDAPEAGAGQLTVALEGAVVYPVQIEIRAYAGDELVGTGSGTLEQSAAELTACVEALAGPPPDGGMPPDGDDEDGGDDAGKPPPDDTGKPDMCLGAGERCEADEDCCSGECRQAGMNRRCR